MIYGSLGDGGDKNKFYMPFFYSHDRIIRPYFFYRPEKGALMSENSNKDDMNIELGLSGVLNVLQCGLVKCSCDKYWRVKYANENFYKMIGYTEQQFKDEKRSSIAALVHVDDLARVRAAYSRTAFLQNLNRKIMEYRIVTRLGRVIDVLEKSALIKEDDGQEYFYLSLIDVTEQRATQYFVQAEQAKLEAVIEHADLYFWEYDVKHKKMDAGFKLINDFDIPNHFENYPESFLKLGLIAKESEADFLAAHHEIEAGKESATIIVKLSPDWNNAWFQMKLTNSYDKDGRPAIAYATCEPIDAYKDMEERFTIAASNEGFFTWTYLINEERVELNGHVDKNNFFGAFFKDLNNVYEDGRIDKENLDIISSLREQLKNGTPTVSARIRMKDEGGTDHWFRLTYTAVLDDNGKPFKAIGSASIIDTLVEAENKYLSFKNYKTMADKNTVALFRLNLTKNQCLDGQSEIPDLQKLDEDGTADGFFKRLSAMFTADKSESHRQMFTRLSFLDAFANNRLSFSHELRMPIGKQEKMWVSAGMNMIENPITNDIEAVFYAIDIDDEKRSDAVIKKLIDTDYAYIGTIDVITGKLFTIAYDNEAIPVPPEDGALYSTICPQNIKRLVDDELYNECLEKTSIDYIVKTLKKKSDVVYMYPMHYEDKLRISKWHYSYSDDTKETLVFTLSNVTDAYIKEQEQRKKLERALVDAQAANIAKSDFLARMSHDMRTPMNGIIGLLKLTLDMELSDEVRDNLMKIDTSSNYLLRLINDNLEMNKIESGKMTLNSEKFIGQELIDYFVAMIRPTISAKNIKLVTDLSMPETRDVLEGDKIRLLQVFTNLVGNAVKYTPSGGTITLAVDIKKDGNMHRGVYKIKDTGIGISKDFLPKIFEPFAQENNGVNMSIVGTGLGMSIVHKIVTSMGGKITIESEQGIGTEVIVYIDLPIAGDKTKEEKNVASKDLGVLKGKTILLCEDHPLNAEIAKRLLEKVGCVIEVAENGEIGYNKFMDSDEYHYDAVLMDIRMPVMDGLQASQQIRSIDRDDAKSVPIIAMTANAFDEDVKKSMEAGMNAHLAKPVNPQLLYQTLADFIEKKNS